MHCTVFITDVFLISTIYITQHNIYTFISIACPLFHTCACFSNVGEDDDMYSMVCHDDDDDSKIYEDLCSLKAPPKVQVVGVVHDLPASTSSTFAGACGRTSP